MPTRLAPSDVRAPGTRHRKKRGGPAGSPFAGSEGRATAAARPRAYSHWLMPLDMMHVERASQNSKPSP